MGLLGEVLSALFGESLKKGKTESESNDWLEECEECGEHYDDCECDDCGDEDCENW